jgi:diguanylate cyclase (GGDEF)-like protein
MAIASGVIDLQLQANGALPVISLRMGMALLAVAPLTVASVNAARNRLLARLNHAADHDALTGTLNRSAFLRRGRELAEHAQRTGGAVVAMMLDIDHFKSVNDRFGHDVGDEVLRQLVRRVSTVIRDHDLLFRWGGEEFLLLLPHTEMHDAPVLAERVRAAIAGEPMLAHSVIEPVRITVSCGVAGTTEAPPTPDALVALADAALYHAKRKGRDRVEVA